MEWGQVFPMAQSALKTGWLSALFGGLLVLWVALFFFLHAMIRGAANAEVALRDGTLVVRGSVYGRDIPLADVDAGAARPVDLGQAGPKSLKWRTNGIGMPGLAAGWFRLGDGEKALVFVTDKSRAVYIPTRQGFAVVVSPGDPGRFLEALRHAAERETTPTSLPQRKPPAPPAI
ncbi:MAG: PH domain-containing protein [Solidesulfovibrio sp. DCME]|uniref:PH domain-containing protein n=1 Tax=Solidesulfovibrio sp. DCME TaxID=3447380 RepID=UPI003D14E5B3